MAVDGASVPPEHRPNGGSAGSGVIVAHVRRWWRITSLGLVALSASLSDARAGEQLPIPLVTDVELTARDLVGVRTLLVQDPGATSVKITVGPQSCGPFPVKEGKASIDPACSLMVSLSPADVAALEIGVQGQEKPTIRKVGLARATEGAPVVVPANGVLPRPDAIAAGDPLTFRIGKGRWIAGQASGTTWTGTSEEEQRLLAAWLAGGLGDDPLLLRRATAGGGEEQWKFTLATLPAGQPAPGFTELTLPPNGVHAWPLAAPLMVRMRWSGVTGSLRVKHGAEHCLVQARGAVATVDLLADPACAKVLESLTKDPDDALEVKTATVTVTLDAPKPQDRSAAVDLSAPKVPWSGPAARALFRVDGDGEDWSVGEVDGTGALSAKDVRGAGRLDRWRSERPASSLLVRVARPTETTFEVLWTLSRAPAGASRVALNGSRLELDLHMTDGNLLWHVSPVDLGAADEFVFVGPADGDRLELIAANQRSCTLDMVNPAPAVPAPAVPAPPVPPAPPAPAPPALPAPPVVLDRASCPELFRLSTGSLTVKRNGRAVGTISLLPATVARDGRSSVRWTHDDVNDSEAQWTAPFRDERNTLQAVALAEEAGPRQSVAVTGAPALPMGSRASMRLDDGSASGEWVPATLDVSSDVVELLRPDAVEPAAMAVYDSWSRREIPGILVVRVELSDSEVELRIEPVPTDTWCRKPEVDASWRDPLFLVCFDARYGAVRPLLPGGVPYLAPNQAMAVVVLSDGSNPVDVTVGGVAGLTRGGTAPAEPGAVGATTPADPTATALSGVYAATWYFAPRLPDGGPAAVRVSTSRSADGETVRAATMELMPRPVYISAIRAGLGLSWSAATDYEIRSQRGSTLTTVQADVVPLRPELVVGYSMAFGPRDDVYPRIVRMPATAPSRLGTYVGLGVLGPSLDGASPLPVGFLTSLYGGLEYEITPSTAFALAAVARRGEGLRSSVRVGDPVNAGTNVIHDAWFPGIAIVANVSPSFFRFARSFATEIAGNGGASSEEGES